MSIFEALMVLGKYFNIGDGQNSDQEVKDAWDGVRNCLTCVLGLGFDRKEENNDDLQ